MNKLSHRQQTTCPDPIIQRLADEDSVPWYMKPKLRTLYLLLFPACMAVETTGGFDAQLINALQIVPSWINCGFLPLFCSAKICPEPAILTIPSDFGDPQGSLQGIIGAAYNLGSVLSLPFIPWTTDILGRRKSILAGSLIMIVGAILQGFSKNGTSSSVLILPLPRRSTPPLNSTLNSSLISYQWPCTS